MDKTEELKANSTRLWDCESSLYDSFELKSFERQLDSAIISSRSLSMPHLSDRRITTNHQQRQPPPPPSPSSSSKISRSIQKLLKSVFRPKQTTAGKQLFRFPADPPPRFYVIYDDDDDKSGARGALSTIPEAPEYDTISPEIRSLVRRTASDRFTASATSNIGISCA